MMNIPNALTLLRIALIPVFVVIYYLPMSGNHCYAALVFVIAALTDLLDGYLARKLDQTSRLGAFLDPVADKLMVAVALVLVLHHHPSIWMAFPAAVIIGREITVSALREWMAEIGARKKVAVSTYGKIKTVVQMVALTLLIYEENFIGIPIFLVGLGLLQIAAIFTLWSMSQYLIAALPKMRE